MNRAVFLDRDGVITRARVRNGKPCAPLSRADVAIVPGVPDALDRLRRAGLLLIVVTNQPDVARGRVSRDEVEAIHAGLRAELPLDDIHVCYHDDDDECACRKPAPGMLYAAAVAHEIALTRSYLVGDRWRDIAAGRRAGCTTILVDGGHEEPVTVDPHATVSDLQRAATWILANERS
jgi:D-glycero-D-manno-heptose 1,7-bisphosphate phosphatase